MLPAVKSHVEHRLSCNLRQPDAQGVSRNPTFETVRDALYALEQQLPGPVRASGNYWLELTRPGFVEVYWES